jgi:hypothetical protein
VALHHPLSDTPTQDRNHFSGFLPFRGGSVYAYLHTTVAGNGTRIRLVYWPRMESRFASYLCTFDVLAVLLDSLEELLHHVCTWRLCGLDKSLEPGCISPCDFLSTLESRDIVPGTFATILPYISYQTKFPSARLSRVPHAELTSSRPRMLTEFLFSSQLNRRPAKLSVPIAVSLIHSLRFAYPANAVERSLARNSQLWMA